MGGRINLLSLLEFDWHFQHAFDACTFPEVLSRLDSAVYMDLPHARRVCTAQRHARDEAAAWCLLSLCHCVSHVHRLPAAAADCKCRCAASEDASRVCPQLDVALVSFPSGYYPLRPTHLVCLFSLTFVQWHASLALSALPTHLS